MARKFNFSIDEFYHIYNRGNGKSIIFRDEADKKRFRKLLYVCNSTEPVVFKTIQGLALDKIKRGETLVDIGAYVLMDNHFHLLVHEKTEGGTSLFIGKLLTAYSMYFNKKYVYLKYLFAYVHLNPVKIIDPEWKENGIKDRVAAKEYLEKYPYSSYHEYMGMTRQESGIVRMNAFPEYFIKPQDFIGFLDDWLFFKDKELEKDRPLQSLVNKGLVV
jgi:REP element-mobilizing transposase RayT